MRRKQKKKHLSLFQLFVTRKPTTETRSVHGRRHRHFFRVAVLQLPQQPDAEIMYDVLYVRKEKNTTNLELEREFFLCYKHLFLFRRALALASLRVSYGVYADIQTMECEPLTNMNMNEWAKLVSFNSNASAKWSSSFGVC